MRKADIIKDISQRTAVPPTEVTTVVETFMKIVKESVSNGENVYLRSFGTFQPKRRAAKIGQNITKGISIHIPETVVPKFKPSKEFMGKIKKHVKPQTNT